MFERISLCNLLRYLINTTTLAKTAESRALGQLHISHYYEDVVIIAESWLKRHHSDEQLGTLFESDRETGRVRGVTAHSKYTYAYLCEAFP